ncbi:MAG: glycosyltransferase, partial [Prevotella sp.]|nr:glycosyltransferase [Prevotella sp.]
DEAVVYVADNASTDTSVSLLQRQFPECRLIQLDRNWGFAEGYNKALGQIQSTRVATKIPEQRSYSLLWHYYVKGRKYFSQLP